MSRRETRKERLARREGFILGLSVGGLSVFTVWELMAHHVLTVTNHP